MGKPKFYAVLSGAIKGKAIFTTWEDCQKVTNGVKGAKHSSFDKYEDAISYLGWTTESGKKEKKNKATKSEEVLEKKAACGNIEIIFVKDKDFEEELKKLDNDINIIVSGGWDYVTDIGYYNVLIKDSMRSKLVSKDNISGTTANRVMLLGIKDALSYIRENNERTINIITTTSLGFKKAQRNVGVNKEMGREVFDVINQKNIKVRIIEFFGCGDAVKTYISKFK